MTTDSRRLIFEKVSTIFNQCAFIPLKQQSGRTGMVGNGCFEVLGPRRMMTGDPTGIYGDSAQLVLDLDQTEITPEILLGAQLGEDYLVLANDGGGNYEIWITDGIESKLIDEVAANLPYPLGNFEYGNNETIKVIGDRAYFLLDFHPKEKRGLYEGGESQLWTVTSEVGSLTKLTSIGEFGFQREFIFTKMENREGSLVLQVGRQSGGDTFSRGTYVSDGTVAGTYEIEGWITSLVDLARLGDDWYLLGALGVERISESEVKEQFGLFQFDALSSNLTLVREFISLSNASDLVVRDGLLFFFADSGDGTQFWQSDGTTKGTIPNENPELGQRPEDSQSQVDERRRFTPYRGLTPARNQNELNILVDGQAQVILTVPASTNQGSSPIAMVSGSDGLFFISERHDSLHRLFDGEVTQLSGDGFVNFNFDLLENITLTELVGESLFVLGKEDLRRYNARTGDLEFTMGGIANQVFDMTFSNDELFFVRNIWRGGELWTVDANENRIFHSQSYASSDSQWYADLTLMEHFDDRVYFTFGEGVNRLLRMYDFAADEEVRFSIGNVQTLGKTSDEQNLFVLASRTLGSGRLNILKTGDDHTELERVTTISARLASSQTASVGDELFFGDTSGNLWKTDGTEAGTQVAYRFANEEATVLHLVGGDDAVYFTVDDGVNGTEVWISDGTMGGTHLAVDIRPGEESSNPTDLTFVNDKLYFVADDGIHGREIWSIDLRSQIPGDTNSDGQVDFRDFLVLASNYEETTGDGFKSGDFDGDGRVLFADFLILSENLGRNPHQQDHAAQIRESAARTDLALETMLEPSGSPHETDPELGPIEFFGHINNTRSVHANTS